MKILITWSAWFIWKELVRSLQENWHYVIWIDINSDNLSNEFYQHDLTIQFTKKIEFDLCFHLASSVWWILFNTEKADIITYNNLLNNNILKILNDNNCDKLIFFSSINGFEWEKDFSHSKLSWLTQESWYALSKAIWETFFWSWMKNLLVIRPTNVFWKSQMRCHERFWESHVIPDLIKKIEISNNEIEIFWDWSQIRNFIHVKDIIDFLIKQLDFKWQNYLNLRSEILITIWELTSELIEISWKNLKEKYLTEYMKYEKMQINNFDISTPVSKWYKANIKTIKEGLEI